MAELMKKMADEICGSLKLMRGGKQTEGGEREKEGGRVNSLFLCLLLLIKERDYTLLSLFIHSVREKETEQETNRARERERESRDNEENEKRESETVRLPLFCATRAADVSALVVYETSPVMLVNNSSRAGG